MFGRQLKLQFTLSLHLYKWLSTDLCCATLSLQNKEKKMAKIIHHNTSTDCCIITEMYVDKWTRGKLCSMANIKLFSKLFIVSQRRTAKLVCHYRNSSLHYWRYGKRSAEYWLIWKHRSLNFTAHNGIYSWLTSGFCFEYLTNVAWQKKFENIQSHQSSSSLSVMSSTTISNTVYNKQLVVFC